MAFHRVFAIRNVAKLPQTPLSPCTDFVVQDIRDS